MNWDEQKATDERHVTNPMPGDYWNDCFVPVLVVLGRVCGRVLICDKIKDVGDNCWTWDLNDVKLCTIGDLRKRLSYGGTTSGYWANVFPEAHKWAAEEVTKMGAN